MTIGECHKCGEQVKEGTHWDVSISAGFTCEGCNKHQSYNSYLENAAWLKEHNRKVTKQIKENVHV